MRGTWGVGAGRRRVGAAAVVGLVATAAPLVAPPLGAVSAAEPAATYLVSRGSAPSTDPDLSPDGRYVAFASHAALAPGDTNGTGDVYLATAPFTGTPALVSVAADGGPANGPSSAPVVSGDGHVVAFTSAASNLVPGDTNGVADVFVRDLFTGRTTRVQGTAQPTCPAGGGASGEPVVSESGRHLAFSSTAANLAAGDTDCTRDVFLLDRDSGALTVVSGGEDPASEPAVSGDGRFVAYTTTPATGTRAWRWSPSGTEPLGSTDPAAGAGQTALGHDGVVAYVTRQTSHQGVTLPAGPKVILEWPGGHWEWVSDGIGDVAVSDPAVSGDGASVAFVAGGAVRVAATESRYGTGGAGYDGRPATVVGPAASGEPAISATGRSVALSTTTSLAGDGDTAPDVAVVAVPGGDSVIHPRLDDLDGLEVPAPLGYVDPGRIPTDHLSGAAPGTDTVQRGIIQRGIIQRGIIQRGIIQRGIIQRGIIQRGIIQRGIIQRGIIQRGIIGNLPLASLPLLTPEGGFVTLLAGTPFDGLPLQAVTFRQVMEWAAAHPDHPQAAKLLGLGLQDFAPGAAIGEISIASIVLLAARLADVPLPGATGGNLEAWQDAVADQGFPRTLVGPDTLLIDLEGAGVDLDATGVGQVPVRSLPVEPSGLPFLLAAGFELDSPLGQVRVAELASPEAVLDCSGGCPTGTLEAHRSRLRDGLTLAALGPQLPARITVEEIARAMVAREFLPWEDVAWSMIGPGRYAIPKDTAEEGPGHAVALSYRAGFDTGPGGPAFVEDAVLEVELPPGTAFHDARFAATGPREFVAPYRFQPGEEREGFEDLGDLVRFHLGDVPSGTTLVAEVEVTDAVDYDQTEPLDAVLSSRTGSDGATITLREPAGHERLVDPPGGDHPATAPSLGTQNRVYFGGITDVEDVDYYTVPRPPHGKRLVVALGSLGGDLDLGVFQVTGDDPAPPNGGAPDPAHLGPTPLLDQREQARLQPAPLNILEEPGYTLLDGSTHTGTDPEQVEVPGTLEGGGPLTVRVASAGRASSLPYTLRWLWVEEPQEQKCPPYAPRHPDLTITGGIVPPAIPAGTKTVFLVDVRRMTEDYGLVPSDLLGLVTTIAQAGTAVAGSLAKLDGRFGVSSAVIPITGTDPGDAHRTSAVVAARAALDRNPCSVSAANDLARAISRQLETFLTPQVRQSLEHVVLVGGDDVIPFFRAPQGTFDVLESWNEPVLRLSTPRTGDCATGLGAPWDGLPCDRYATPVSAAAHGSFILTDDPYADPTPTKVFDRHLSVPDVAVARLGETPSEINRAVLTFLQSEGELTADTSLLTGYGAWNEVPDTVTEALGDRVAGRNTRLQTEWSKQQMLSALFPTGAAPNLVSINAHASETDLLPAVPGADAGHYQSGDLVTAAEIAAERSRLKGTLLFTIGCHAGGPLPDTWYGTGALDWPQALGGVGGYVANTGFGIADTAALGLSERLMTLYADELSSSVTAGQALSRAKHAYLRGLGQYLGYDEKILMQTTYYGLPMYRLRPAGSDSLPRPPQPATWSQAATDPVAGLTARSTTLTPTFAEHTGPDGSGYLTSGEEPQVSPGHPLLAKMTVGVDPVAGAVPTGALVTGASSTFGGPERLAVADASVGDLTGPARYDDIAFPASIAHVTAGRRLVVLTDRVDAESTGTATTGRTERFTRLDLTTYFGDGTGRPPALRSASTEAGGRRTFTVTATDDGGPGSTRRAVLLLQERGSTEWVLHEMSRASGDTWSVTLPDPGDFRAFTQVVDDDGMVGIDLNRGHFVKGSTHAPVFSGPESLTIREGTRWLDELTISDPDSSRFTGRVDFGFGPEEIPVETGPDGLQRGLLEILGHRPGVFPVRIEVCDDSGLCSAYTFQLTVESANRAPQSSVSLSPLQPGSDDVLTATAAGTDPDGDPVSLTYRWWVNDRLVRTGGTTFDLGEPGHGDLGDTVTVTVTPDDGYVGGGGSSASVVIEVNDPPLVGLPAAAAAQEGVELVVAGTVEDPEGGPLRELTVDFGDGTAVQPVRSTGGTFELRHVYADDGARTVTVRAVDAAGAVATATMTADVANRAPTLVGETPPAPVALGQPTVVVVRFADVAADTHTATIAWGDGTSSPMTVDQASDTATASHTYLAASTYPLTVTVADDDGGSTTTPYGFASVYDASAGYVSASGYYISPPGAWPANPTASGKAEFGLNTKYTTGKTAPTGKFRLTFDIQPEDRGCNPATCLAFDSTSFTSLTVTGDVATLHGRGTLEGKQHLFLVTVRDGDPERVRIKIWLSGKPAVYDTQPGAPDSALPTTPMLGGSVVLKKP